ncbi:MAG: hypothetical protein RBT63_11290 [Bdellovibrionales bacterium]|jgi:hypothetical protein|nr:hypothetical protein [Bdellovibrionales bacterium]
MKNQSSIQYTEVQYVEHDAGLQDDVSLAALSIESAAQFLCRIGIAVTGILTVAALA